MEKINKKEIGNFFTNITNLKMYINVIGYLVMQTKIDNYIYSLRSNLLMLYDSINDNMLMLNLDKIDKSYLNKKSNILNLYIEKYVDIEIIFE